MKDFETCEGCENTLLCSDIAQCAKALVPAAGSAILERIRVNDQFLDIVNGLYCDSPNLFESLRRKALPLHADVNRILRKMLRDSQQNKDYPDSNSVELGRNQKGNA